MSSYVLAEKCGRKNCPVARFRAVLTVTPRVLAHCPTLAADTAVTFQTQRMVYTNNKRIGVLFRTLQVFMLGYVIWSTIQGTVVRISAAIVF
jgi:hypothetical protein